MSETVLCLADLQLDISKLEVSRGNQAIQLRRKEWQLLVYLLQNQGNLVTRDMILDHIWPDDFDVFPNLVSVHIKYLRDKIDKPFAKPLIKTVHGWGYKLTE